MVVATLAATMLMKGKHPKQRFAGEATFLRL